MPDHSKSIRKPWYRPRTAIVAMVAFGLWWGDASSADAQVESSDEPAVITADEVVFDDRLGIVVAVGNVEISQEGRLLRAERVIYNQRTDIVTATGNVVLVEPTGDVLFAEYAELEGDLAEGFIETVGILFADQSRVAANSGVRRDGTVTEVERGVYSPCNLCEDGSGTPPLWQVRAVRVIHDQETRDVIYRDAFLDFFGIPLLYTPYLRHPDPTVEQRSGFLAPRFGSDSNLGAFAIVPYYIAIDPSQDATVRAGVTADAGYILRGEYRRRFSFGQIQFDGSVNRSERIVDEGEPGEREEIRNRGHFFADGDFTINEHWRAGGDLRLVSDDTYLDTFDISDDDVLTSRAYLEGFYGLSFASIEALSFRDLRAGAEEQPQILPLAQFNYVAEPGGTFGGTVSANTQFLYLESGEERTQRLSLSSAWNRRDFLPYGLVADLTASLRNDLYVTDNILDPDDGTVRDDVVANRLYPLASASLAYPLVRQTETTHQLVEPTIAFIASDTLDNDEPIPNNDSFGSEFDDINLFSDNRSSGIDSVDEGVRIAYGVRTGIFADSGEFGEVFVGQSYQLDSEPEFTEGSGLEDRISDIVGRVNLSPGPYLNVSYRFRLDHEDLTPRRHELDARAQYRGFSVGVDYLMIDEVADTDEDDEREEITLTAAATLTDYWTVSSRLRRDLEENEGRDFQVGLRYLDECFLFRVDFTRDFTADRDRESGDSVVFSIGFRNLGETVGFGGAASGF